MIKRKNNKHTHLHNSKLWVGNSKLNKTPIIIFILFVFAITFMTVGFARYGKTVNLGGTVLLKPDGKIYIDSVTLKSKQNAIVSPDPQVTSDGNVDFNLSFKTNGNEDTQYEAIYEIVIKNDSSYDYVYRGFDYSPKVTKNGEEQKSSIDFKISGIKIGDKIASKGEPKTITATFKFTDPDIRNSGTYVVEGDFYPDMNEDTSATLMAAVDDTTEGDLRGDKELAAYTITVINTYNVPKTFTLEADSDKYVTKDQNGNDHPQFTVEANNGEGTDFTFYLAKVDGAEYVASREAVRIVLVQTGETVATGMNAGKVKVLVDITNQEYVDETPPTIRNVVASDSDNQGNITEGTVYVSWKGEDDTGAAPVEYTIYAYRGNTKVAEKTVSGTTERCTFTGLTTAGTYNFVVFGKDESGNEASQSDITSATTSAGYACRSNDLPIKWIYTVTFTSSENTLTSSGSSTAKKGQTYTTTLKVKDTDNYKLPSQTDVKVTMGGTNFYAFTYSSDTGILTIENVSGDITIKANAASKGTCLVEGTKILLANGKYKNIEDIKYTDLLAVYDHVNGKMTEVYPIWIEKEGKSNNYRKITFNDGTYLKIVNNHSLFDVDKKRYVDASNDKEFKIGSRVYKVENSKLEIVTVTNIEDIEEEVKYYSIVSTVFYNIIANDILTTDTTSSISNVYGFENQAKYGVGYKILSKGKGLEYEDIDCIPYYLYKGLNLKNAKLLLNKQLNAKFLSNFVEERTIEPISKNGKRYFMVTTSLDNVNESNVDKFLYKEGSIYTLPKENVKYYIETSTNKRYEPGHSVKVENSIHFKAIK